MNTTSTLKHAIAAALLTAALASPARAAMTNAWNNAAGGSWNSAANWTPAGPPNAIDSLADFSTLNLAANVALTLDSTPTIGTLIFGDLNSTKHNWALTSGTGGALTLGVSSGTPQINVTGGTATLGVVLAGSSGMAKLGIGTLTLNSANTYSGGTLVSNGTLFLDFSASGAPTADILPNGSPLAMSGGTLQLTNAASTANTQTLGNPNFSLGGASIIASPGVSGSIELVLGSSWTRNPGASVRFPGTGTITTGSSSPALNNGILGGWATVGENFATASLNAGNYNIVAATPSVTLTTGSGLSSAGATANVLVTTTVQTVGSTATINSLISQSKNVSISSGVTLTLASGGLIMANGNFYVTGGGTLTSGFNDGMGTNDLTITVDKTSYSDMEINGVTLANSGTTPVSFIKNGVGALQFSTKVSYTGATIVNGGTLKLAPSDTLDTSSAVIINNGGTISCNGNNAIFGSGSAIVPVTVNAGGTLTMAAGDTAHIKGVVTLNGGTLATTDAGSGTYGSWNIDNSSFIVNGGPVTSTIISSNVTLASPTTFNVASGASSGIDLNVPGYFKSGALTKAGAGTMKLSNANNNTGLTTVSQGILALGFGGQNGTLAPAAQVAIASGATLRTDVADATGWGASGALTNSGTLLKGPGSFDETLARPIFLNAGTITSADLGNNSQPLNLFGQTLSTVAGSGVSTISLPAGANFGLRVNGAANPAFNVAAGSSLVVNTVLGNWDAAGDPLIKNGAGTMTVNGALAGDLIPVTVNSGTLNLSALTYTNAGTITVANGATLQVSSLTANGAAGSLTINVNSSSYWAPGTYKLFGYSGIVGGTGVSAFKLGTVQLLGGRQTATINLNTPGEVDMDIAGVDYPVWTGLLDGTWTLGSQSNPKNWMLAIAGTPTDFFVNDIVVFDDTAANPSINISAAAVAPASVTFSNTVLNYALGGNYGITGTALLAKNGAGILTINNSNSYSGGTVINGGTLTIGSSGVLGAGPVTLNGGALNISTSRALGAGPVTLNGGALNISTSGALGAGALAFNGGTISPTGQLVLANSASSVGGDFAIGGTSSDGLTLNSALNLGGTNRTITIGSSSNVFAGVLSNGGLTKNGSGTLALKAFNTYSDGTVVNGGTLAMEVGGANGPINGTLTINPGATFRSDAQDSLGWNGGANQVTTLNIIGGTLTHTPAINLTMINMTINMTGGLLQAVGAAGSRLDLVSPVAINTMIGGGTATIGGRQLNLRQPTTLLTVADDAAAADLLISATITEQGGSCGLTKVGPGTLVLTGSNTYSGATLVNAGALVLNGSSQSPITIGTAAAFSLGDAFGTVSISNNLTLAGTTLMKIAKAASLTNDLVQVSSNLACGGTLVVTNLGLAPLVQGDSFTLFQAAAFSGSFTFVLPALSSGLVWDTSQNGIVRVMATTSTGIAQSAPNTIQSQALTFTAAVTSLAGTPTGSVAFSDGTNILSTVALDGSGLATLNTASLAVGDHSIIASYLGNDSYTASASSALAHTVIAATVPVISQQPTNVTVRAGTNTTLLVSADSNVALSYQWYQIEDTSTNALADDGTNILGSALSSLTLTNLALTNAGYYYVVVSNMVGTAVSSNVVVTLVTVEPVDQAVMAGTAANFSVVAVGGPVTYQWQSRASLAGNWSDIVDATNATYTTTALSLSDSGTSYHVLVNGVFESVPATVTVSQAATSVTLISSATLSQLGESVTFTATVSAVAPGAGTATGSVQFLTNGVETGLPVALAEGVAAYVTSDLPTGTNIITAQYSGDGNFVGSSNSLQQVVNSAPVAGVATYGPQNGLALTISIADLLTHASDADGDLLTLYSVSATSSNGGSIVTNETSVIYTPLDHALGADSFSYVVSDGRGGFATGTIVIREAVLVSPTLQITRMVDGSMQLLATGTPYGQYAIQAASVLDGTWTSLSTNVAGADGLIIYSDLNVTNHPIRFYRTFNP
jgi:autotransporter-associated beta strand protein